MHARRLLLQTAVFAILLCSLTVKSQAQPVIDGDGYVFGLPVAWSLLNKEGPKGFDNYNFHNDQGELVQFGVSRKLNSATYARAKSNLRAGLTQDRSRHGWTLVQGRSFNQFPYGEFDETIYVDKSSNLTSFSYSVYGPDRIAVFTITFKGWGPERTTEARRLMAGLKWK